MSVERSVAADALTGSDARLTRLREAAALIARMAGETPKVAPAADLLAADARAAVRLADLPPVVARRYDAVATETATIARAGMALLVDLPTGPGVAAAAAALAADIRRGLARMTALIG